MVVQQQARSHPNFEGLPKGEDPHATHEAKPHQDRRHWLSFCWSTSNRSARLSELFRPYRLWHWRESNG